MGELDRFSEREKEERVKDSKRKRVRVIVTEHERERVRESKGERNPDHETHVRNVFVLTLCVILKRDPIV